MTSRVFETSLKAFQTRQPFKPYVVELVSGTEILVQQPEAVVSHAGAVVYFSAEGAINLFDADSVSALRDLRKEL